MRIAPIALFTHSEPIPVVIDMAKQSAKVTHANRLQRITMGHFTNSEAVAIRDALLHKGENINPLTFVERLIACMRMVEKYTEEEIIDHNKKSEYIYCSALEKIKFLLEKGNDVTISDVVDSLGNEISAPGSVPTAIYVFLRAQKQIEAVETDNPFQRTIHYAVSLGGDTDTIAAMAGNIAGAFYGVEKIPEGFMHHCEGVEEMNKLAKELGNLDR
ncbi:Poly(ADP-ribose) glycohydrolase ARH3 [Armadillidium vulgare]|nr:Poly(ADP-ribose) glycohydrolase ARH3 [Armadillidium vulgare]